MSEDRVGCRCEEPSATAVRLLRALKLLLSVLTMSVGLWTAVGASLP